MVDPAPHRLVGLDGRTLNARWGARAEAYLSVAVDGFPNLFFAYGPNSGINSGNLLVILERQVEYAVMATLKMQRERLGSMVVKREAMESWRAYMKVRGVSVVADVLVAHDLL